MKIKAIRKIENYRNLSSQSIQFDENVNFIIGENEIGKTNILELISRFFIEKHFLESDYYDLSKPVKITFELEDHTLLKGIQYPHSSLQINHEYKINGLFLKDIHPKDEQSYIQSIFKQIHTVKAAVQSLIAFVVSGGMEHIVIHQAVIIPMKHFSQEEEILLPLTGFISKTP